MVDCPAHRQERTTRPRRCPRTRAAAPRCGGPKNSRAVVRGAGPGRREFAPPASSLVRTVPAFGPWDDRAATPRPRTCLHARAAARRRAANAHTRRDRSPSSSFPLRLQHRGNGTARRWCVPGRGVACPATRAPCLAGRCRRVSPSSPSVVREFAETKSPRRARCAGGAMDRALVEMGEAALTPHRPRLDRLHRLCLAAIPASGRLGRRRRPADASSRRARPGRAVAEQRTEKSRSDSSNLGERVTAGNAKSRATDVQSDAPHRIWPIRAEAQERRPTIGTRLPEGAILIREWRGCQARRAKSARVRRREPATRRERSTSRARRRRFL